MDKEHIPEEQDTDEDKGFFKKLLSIVDFRKPGTKEDLDLEIQEILEEGEEHGLISPLEEKMINSILDIRETDASQIMTPAAEVVSFDAVSPMSEIIEVVIESGFTRIPVYKDNPDNVIGAIHAKDLLRLCARPSSDTVNLTDYLRSVYFIEEDKLIVDLLREFQRRKVHMAMVTDEFGTMRGLITLEDILEEIVGEIDDEYDDEEHTVEVIDEGTVEVHGWVDIEKIEDHFGLEMPDGPYESVGGLVIQLLGRLAQTGDSVEVSGLQFEVVSASTRQIKKIRVTRLVEEG
ncbi:MAG: CBS domain containing-hemolysin-like protein [Desulforhopalus sp.]|jgi:CBS domain containing-hemolysin-like protein